jgi:hypothetical protein
MQSNEFVTQDVSSRLDIAGNTAGPRVILSDEFVTGPFN